MAHTQGEGVKPKGAAHSDYFTIILPLTLIIQLFYHRRIDGELASCKKDTRTPTRTHTHTHTHNISLSRDSSTPTPPNLRCEKMHFGIPGIDRIER